MISKKSKSINDNNQSKHIQYNILFGIYVCINKMNYI